MRRVLRLRSPIMPYAWGSRRAIRSIRGLGGEAQQPEAELWMGAHPKAPSEAWIDGCWMPLDELIAAYPKDILGVATTNRFGARLPFLMKVLAAAEPLSIQAHPDASQAKAGFAHEEALGIPLGAPDRNYRDDRHKPELIVALEPFTIMRGFRAPAEIRHRLERLGLVGELPVARSLGSGPDGGLRALFTACLELSAMQAEALVRRAVAAADADDIADRWLVRLADDHPDDPGALAPIWLRVAVLEPGEAVYTGPGVLHAYLRGTGIEIMASSDNVLRGGLTEKHVDIAELVSVLRFEATSSGLSLPQDEGATRTWPVPAADFELSLIHLGADSGTGSGSVHRHRRDVVEILFATAGQAVLRTASTACLVAAGEAFLIPAAVGTYSLEGAGRFFVASVP